MAIPSIQQEKQSYRKRFRKILADLGADECATWSERIVRHLAIWLRSEVHPRRVALYAAFGNEVDLAGLHDHLASCEFVYPRLVATGLEFCHVPDPALLQRGQFGIREPNPAHHAMVEPREIDAVLCPGLAFGLDGSRLGRGKGYYDVALRAMRADIPLVGIGYVAQQRATLPTEPHDVRMTHLASEEGIRASATPTPEAGA